MSAPYDYGRESLIVILFGWLMRLVAIGLVAGAIAVVVWLARGAR